MSTVNIEVKVMMDGDSFDDKKSYLPTHRADDAIVLKFVLSGPTRDDAIINAAKTAPLISSAVEDYLNNTLCSNFFEAIKRDPPGTPLKANKLTTVTLDT